MDDHILITGAGSGIGRAVAIRLAGGGARLSLLARGVERLEETAIRCREQGAGSVQVLGCDIRDRGQVEGVFEEAVGRYGPLRALVANSGIGGANEPGGEDRWSEVIATNLDGTYWCLRAAQAHLVSGPEPRHLVVMSSVLARFGVPGYTAYCASKTGLLGLVRALALELAADNVQVNALCPGWVDTDMAREGIDGMAEGMGISHQEAYAEAMSAVPLGRMSRPEEIAGVVAWLLSADAVGVTGQGIDVNGGSFMI
ncbi:MAG: SDR family NAD(P)-dependent oxidoreductase [Planctomycetota bacterium]|nr:SDR family NAD(P)-dependent oxidoreductase [Planctomycetota bacterium]